MRDNNNIITILKNAWLSDLYGIIKSGGYANARESCFVIILHVIILSRYRYEYKQVVLRGDQSLILISCNNDYYSSIGGVSEFKQVVNSLIRYDDI